jgi:cell filamentation protein
MKNNYRYIDPDYTYTDPQTGVLRNKANIDTAELLLKFESLKVMSRTEELQSHPIKIKDAYIHYLIYTSIYSRMSMNGQEKNARSK